MPIRTEKRFCTIFTRTEAEKRTALMSKELDSTKKELNKTSEELDATKKALDDLAKEVELLRSSIQNGSFEQTVLAGSKKEEKKTDNT